MLQNTKKLCQPWTRRCDYFYKVCIKSSLIWIVIFPPCWLNVYSINIYNHPAPQAGGFGWDEINRTQIILHRTVLKSQEKGKREQWFTFCTFYNPKQVTKLRLILIQENQSGWIKLHFMWIRKAFGLVTGSEESRQGMYDQKSEGNC